MKGEQEREGRRYILEGAQKTIEERKKILNDEHKTARRKRRYWKIQLSQQRGKSV